MISNCKRNFKKKKKKGLKFLSFFLEEPKYQSNTTYDISITLKSYRANKMLSVDVVLVISWFSKYE